MAALTELLTGPIGRNRYAREAVRMAPETLDLRACAALMLAVPRTVVCAHALHHVPARLRLPD